MGQAWRSTLYARTGEYVEDEDAASGVIWLVGSHGYL